MPRPRNGRYRTIHLCDSLICVRRSLKVHKRCSIGCRMIRRSTSLLGAVRWAACSGKRDGRDETQTGHVVPTGWPRVLEPRRVRTPQTQWARRNVPTRGVQWARSAWDVTEAETCPTKWRANRRMRRPPQGCQENESTCSGDGAHRSPEGCARPTLWRWDRTCQTARRQQCRLKPKRHAGARTYACVQNDGVHSARARAGCSP